jgi:peroxiredoxin
MKYRDKQNLIRAVPVYALCVMLLAGVGFFYWKHPPPKKAEPLRKSLARYFEKGHSEGYSNLDEVINDRTTWQPMLAERVGQAVEAYEFTDIEGRSHRLTDFAGGPLIVVQWATWAPGCTMQLGHWQELRRRHPDVTVLAFSSESEETLKRYAPQVQGILTLIRQQAALPAPLSEVSDIPSAFFLDRQGKLFLAARGLIPFEHAEAILGLMEGQSHEEENSK